MEMSSSSDHRLSSNRQDRRRSSYLRRFQLLRYHDVARLRAVMETIVPIHGTGNFPTLEIRPSLLVQLVRDRLEAIGVKVRDIRLNGSAATHVLSDDTSHKYKDLDLIFTIDFPKENVYTASTRIVCNQTVTEETSKPEHVEPNAKGIDSASNSRPTSLPTANLPHTSTSSKHFSDDSNLVDDSGYTSSGSSATSAPVSPSCPSMFLLRNKSEVNSLRTRTGSLESISSTSSHQNVPSSRDSSHNSRIPNHQFYPENNRCWQEIKDAAMATLLEFLPEGVNRSKITGVVLGGAYVEKMVKVTNESDRWSLISLNNNAGRNLEFKFVQSMKRQFEFSVDSFQIVLDTYLAFCKAARQNEEEPLVKMTENFHPTVIAESVYGDFAAALRHLRERRICTHRPEEIRGGGLLRYCNLRVRGFKPGDVATGDCDQQNRESSFTKRIFDSSDPEEVAKLEQHMCSRFFIDFNDINRQRNKLICYVNDHFSGEEDLKFQYLVVLRQVVDKRTVCLMQQERSMILDLITLLLRQTLANNVAKNSREAAIMHQRIQHDFYFSSQQHCYAKKDTNQPQLCCPEYSLTAPFPTRDGSSPIFSYCTSPFVRSTSSSPANVSSSTLESPRSGSVTPNNPYQPGNRSVSPVCPPGGDNQFASYCNCCCGCCCCGRTRTNSCYSYSYQPLYGNQSQYSVPSVNPIIYSPGNMTCYYQPAPAPTYAGFDRT